MHGCARAQHQVQAQRFLRFHAVHVHDRIAFGNGQVARLARGRHQAAQDAAAHSDQGIVAQGRQRQVGGRRTGHIAASHGRAQHIAVLFQRIEQAHHAGLGHLHARRQLRQGQGLAGAGQVLDQAQHAQAARLVAVGRRMDSHHAARRAVFFGLGLPFLKRIVHVLFHLSRMRLFPLVPALLVFYKWNQTFQNIK